MTDSHQQALPTDLGDTVAQALAEDLGEHDRNAALIEDPAQTKARIITQEAAIVAGAAWVNTVFTQLTDNVTIDWHVSDGARATSDTILCTLTGPTRALLSGERTALNFLQLLTGVANNTRDYVDRVAGTGTAIVDTRKTLPGLRSAQKYAVVCGGGRNHRFGQFDAYLIKENHLAAIGSIATAVARARANAPDLFLQVEVETIEQLDEALSAGVDGVLLDNFPTHLLTRAVNKADAHRRRFRQQLLIEASGDIDLANVREIADTGVDQVSLGGLTKHVRAANLSLQFAG
ncbi:carboxylating nicotinate-nucleotide diphosphorylase [Salinisphaera sp. USBA-960]|nr:carboxylating nicotinate-nucleotide diphosphorylase [Salifodinibacter halophilus]NNC26248.1 carboxylating nicotinate-nucleotide diphosphorylase [Salifodinibacter halophilus]